MAVIRPGKPSIEAFLGEEESEDTPGTEVTRIIPPAFEQLNPQGIMRQLWKYVGYLDPKQSRILLNNQLVNTFAREYLSGVSVDVAVNGSAMPLVFSFSKRALRKDFSDERFDDRNQNLQHIVYTHSGLFVKYGSNPFDPRTIYGQLFDDLIKNGLDFWIQLPRNVGLISGRYDIDSSHANQMLDASYDAFRSLVLDSILGDEQILYHES